MVRTAAFIIILLMVFVGACARHDDNPPPLHSLIEPPVPQNLTVTPTDTTATRFDLRWDVSDPSVVDFYKVYLIDPIFGTTFLDTTQSTTVQVITGVTFVTVTFGVSSVTVENVEGVQALKTWTSLP